MDWFERLTGFPERDYESTRALLDFRDGRLTSSVNGQSYGIGHLEVPTLAELRERAKAGAGATGSMKVRIVTGDVGALHRQPEVAGALFQVASQFNLLEMTSPRVTPEDGVTRYRNDPTQGPACAIAAGAATIYRNYGVVMKDGVGQTRTRQIDALSGVGDWMVSRIGGKVSDLWSMENGYAMCRRTGLSAINDLLSQLSPVEQDELRGQLAIGLHWDVEVTASDFPRQVVSQAFCSALPVAYGAHLAPAHDWEAFARLILEASYEATLWAAVENARRGMSNIVLLTRVGGGVFGNADEWIDDAIMRALRLTQDFDLDVRMVSYGRPAANVMGLCEKFS